MKNFTARAVFAGCVGIMLAAAPLTSAQAFNFRYGDVKGALDIDLNYGLQIRTDDADAANSGAYGNRFLYPNRFDVFSNQVRTSATFELEYENFGALVRGNYFYDLAADNQLLIGEAEDKLVEEHAFTDAFIYGYFGANQELNIRLGKQVISWGENTFIQGSLNDINTVDLTKLRQPGRELKDAFIGTEAAYASYNFLDNWTLEGFYLLQFDQTKLDPMGSFFTTLDGVATGGGQDGSGNGVLGDGAVPIPGPPGPHGFGDCRAFDGAVCDLLGGLLTRTTDREASNSGQYGAALRVFLPTVFQGTELGFYYQNLHDHGPIVSAYVGTGFYFLDYVEDIKRYGVSFNTNIGGVAVGGEYSFRKDVPMQISAPLAAGLGGGPLVAAAGALAALPVGTYVPGYQLVDRHQVQVTMQKIYGVVHELGADNGMSLVEIAYGRIDDLPAVSALGFGFTNIFEPGITDDFSRINMLHRLTYESAIFNLIEASPFVAYSLGIHGNSQELGGGKVFVDDAQALTLGVNFAYQGGRYKGGVSWTNFFGSTAAVNNAGGRLNGRTDRDFLQFSLGMSF